MKANRSRLHTLAIGCAVSCVYQAVQGSDLLCCGCVGVRERGELIWYSVCVKRKREGGGGSVDFGDAFEAVRERKAEVREEK